MAAILKGGVFKLTLQIDILSASCKLVVRRMLPNSIDGKSTLVQVMAWCYQAASHYLSQHCTWSMSPLGDARRVNSLAPGDGDLSSGVHIESVSGNKQVMNPLDTFEKYESRNTALSFRGLQIKKEKNKNKNKNKCWEIYKWRINNMHITVLAQTNRFEGNI